MVTFFFGILAIQEGRKKAEVVRQWLQQKFAMELKKKKEAATACLISTLAAVILKS